MVNQHDLLWLLVNNKLDLTDVRGKGDLCKNKNGSMMI